MTDTLEWSNKLVGPTTSCEACRWHIHDPQGNAIDGASNYEIARSLVAEYYPQGHTIRPVRGRITPEEAHAALAVSSSTTGPAV